MQVWPVEPPDRSESDLIRKPHEPSVLPWNAPEQKSLPSPIPQVCSFYTLLTETCRSLFRTLAYLQILLKTLFEIRERRVSHLSLAQIA